MAHLKYNLKNFSGNTQEGIPYILDIEDTATGISITLKILQRGLFRYQRNVYVSKDGPGTRAYVESILKAEEAFGIHIMELSI